MQGVVDRQMNQVQVQGTRTQTLINNKAPKWQIIDERETLRQTIQEGTKVEASVTPACEAMEIASDPAAQSSESSSTQSQRNNLRERFQLQRQRLILIQE